ncbi:hypothetical protein BGZ99_001784, partial [Dissophora globulifera]
MLSCQDGFRRGLLEDGNQVGSKDAGPRGHSSQSDILVLAVFEVPSYVGAEEGLYGTDVLECRIPPLRMGSVSAYLTFMSSPAPLDQNDATVRSVTQKPMRFNYDNWFLKKSWEVRKAQKAYCDYGINAMLRLAGGNESTKVVNLNIIFCIGHGSFNTGTGLPTKHGEFERWIVCR